MRLAGGHTVDPHQLLGIEVNPRAAAIAELVLWIGYLQWHFRTHGRVTPPEPVIKNFKNIECRDAVLSWSSKEPELDEHGKPVTRWDGRTTKPHPVTGEEVPDETARVLSFRYLNPQKAEWPKADYVVGNPPFVGIGRMRDALGDGYATTLRQTYSRTPGVMRLRDVLVAQGGRIGAVGRIAAIRVHHDEQPAADLQPSRHCSTTWTATAALSISLCDSGPSVGRLRGWCCRAHLDDRWRRGRSAGTTVDGRDSEDDHGELEP